MHFQVYLVPQSILEDEENAPAQDGNERFQHHCQFIYHLYLGNAMNYQNITINI